MDRKAAINLLDEIFGNGFNEKRFSIFIKEIFNHFDISPNVLPVAKEYTEYIDSFHVLGSYKHDRNVIDVIVVRLKKSTSVERARTMQRNFVAKYLSNTEKDAALVSFYYDGEPDWRFSFVKMEYRLAAGDKGRVKVEKEITPVRRFSFLVGKNEPNYTCKRQFLELVMQEEILPSILDIESAFSIEKVTKEFFNEYKDLYLDLKDSIDKILKKNAQVKKEFDEGDITSADFSKKLLGQIVFIYFLQKKGWLGVQIDEMGHVHPWGTGPMNFLRKLFNKEVVNYRNFFNDILEPLFYEALATRNRDDDYYSKFRCKIPFLNGGLFEPIGGYNWVTTDILIDNSIFKRILDTFDRYNFTIKEDEPLEKEVAIDPEMLGKVFENLLEIKDRKSTGSYYTGREIVHYMCQQSLTNYLESNTTIPRNDVEKFVRFGEFVNVEDVEALTLPNSIIQNRDKIDSLLQDIKIVDPAVGSGAFPVGMMTEIVKARTVLTPFFPEHQRENRTSYNLKRKTIENCLYGVDIDSSAVDIAKLRFWLSLVVDEVNVKNIKPLPNLDHRIMVGNSLIDEFEGIKLFNEKVLYPLERTNYKLEQIQKETKSLQREYGEICRGERNVPHGRIKEIKQLLKRLDKIKRDMLSKDDSGSSNSQTTLEEAVHQRILQSKVKLNKLKKLQKQFFDEQDRNQKKEYAEQIERIEWELIEETLKEQGNDAAVKKLSQYKKTRSKPFFLWKLYFSEVFQRDNPGFDIVIANPPYGSDLKEDEKQYLDNKYYDKRSQVKNSAIYFIYIANELLRKEGTNAYIVPKSLCYSQGWNRCANVVVNGLQKLIDMGKAFENVKLEQVVFIRNIRKDVPIYSSGIYDGEKIVELTEIDKQLFTDFGVLLTGQNLEELKLIKKIRNMTNHRWSDYCMLVRGLNWQALAKNKKNLGKTSIHRGVQLSKYFLDMATDFIDLEKFSRTDYEYQFKPKILNQLAIAHVKNPIPHFLLQATVDFQNRLVFETISCTFVKDHHLNIKFMLAINNSKLFAWILYKFVFSNAIRSMRYDEQYVGKIFCPDFRKIDSRPIARIVDQILSITDNRDYLSSSHTHDIVKDKIEKIDQLVYNLYGLTPKEIDIVEGRV